MFRYCYSSSVLIKSQRWISSKHPWAVPIKLKIKLKKEIRLDLSMVTVCKSQALTVKIH